MEKNNSYTNMLSAIENVKDNIARNVSDFFRFSDQLSNALDTLNQILGILYSSELTDMCQRSSQIISSASKGFTATTELSHFMQGFFASIGQNTNIIFHVGEYSKMLSQLTNAFFDLAETVSPTSIQEIPPVVISEETIESIRKLEPFVPEEERKEFEEIVAPSEGIEKVITFDNFCTLVSLIAAIISIFYYAQAIATGLQSDRQQKLENESQQKEIELREDELEMFREFFEYIKENGISLPGQPNGLVEQVEPFNKQVEVLNDSAVPDEQANDNDALDNVQNSQE